MKYLSLLITVNLSLLMVCLVCTKSHHHHHGHHDHHGTIHKSRRIHPGHRMNPNDTKFMAVLYKTCPAARWIVCSATIIDRQHLLTAAHCVSNQSEWSQINIVPATFTFDTKNLRGGRNELRKTIEKVWLHPRYSHDSEPYFDVAIIRMNNYWRKIKQVFLPSVANPGLYQTPFKAYGHVETDNTKTIANAPSFREAHVVEMIVDHILPQAECVNHLHILWVIYDQYDMFCVANPTRTQPDRIDAGGPLIDHKVKTDTTDPVLLGIRSVGNRHVYYYVNVTTMMTWITQTLTTARLRIQGRSRYQNRIRNRS